MFPSLCGAESTGRASSKGGNEAREIREVSRSPNVPSSEKMNIRQSSAPPRGQVLDKVGWWGEDGVGSLVAGAPDSAKPATRNLEGGGGGWRGGVGGGGGGGVGGSRGRRFVDNNHRLFIQSGRTPRAGPRGKRGRFGRIRPWPTRRVASLWGVRLRRMAEIMFGRTGSPGRG